MQRTIARILSTASLSRRGGARRADTTKTALVHNRPQGGSWESSHRVPHTSCGNSHINQGPFLDLHYGVCFKFTQSRTFTIIARVAPRMKFLSSKQTIPVLPESGNPCRVVVPLSDFGTRSRDPLLTCQGLSRVPEHVSLCHADGFAIDSSCSKARQSLELEVLNVWQVCRSRYYHCSCVP